MMIKYPIGIQDFESLRNDGYLYVDKTALVRKLIETGKYYFLSRPRRFGKSLLLSTIKAYFEGKRKLFEGLAIDSDDMEWTAYPVLYLDMNAQRYDSIERLNSVLDDFLKREETRLGIFGEGNSYGLRFCNVIRTACEKNDGRRVVILVDEYDKPLLQAIGDEALQDDARSTLKGFYGALKSMDGYIKFAMLTGVTKFGKISVFSDLNHLKDISMDTRFHDICGITEAEMCGYFKDDVHNLAKENALSYGECMDMLRARYDGYHFDETSTGIYNPFSILRTLDCRKYSNYWFETGTPSYLVQLLKLHNYRLETLENVVTSADVLNSIDTNDTNPIPVIYQSGYLTIKSYNPRFKTYTLGFPNAEVKEGFISFLVPYYSSINAVDSAFQIQCFVDDVENGRTRQFVDRLRSFFADTPYELIKDTENHYQNVLFIICSLMGFYTKAEYHTSEGRIDMVIKTKKYCYVLEFKLNGTAEEALRQINNKSYALPFEVEDQTIIKIGMNFSGKTRNIDGVCIEYA